MQQFVIGRSKRILAARRNNYFGCQSGFGTMCARTSQRRAAEIVQGKFWPHHQRETQTSQSSLLRGHRLVCGVSVFARGIILPTIQHRLDRPHANLGLGRILGRHVDQLFPFVLLDLSPSRHPQGLFDLAYLAQTRGGAAKLEIDLQREGLVACHINIRIRQARLSDAAVIAEFNLRLAWETERLQLDPEVVRQGVVAVLGDEHKGIYHVAELKESIVGQLMITYEWSDWRNGNLWWIQSVFVKEEFRGQGVFRALFAHLATLALSTENVAGLRLYMHADNAAARQTYERVGMKRSHYEVFERDFVLDRKQGMQA